MLNGEKTVDAALLPPNPDAADRLYEKSPFKLPPLARPKPLGVFPNDCCPKCDAGGEVKRGGGEVMKLLP